MIYLHYLLAFAILFILEIIYFRIAHHYNIIDRPNERSSHTRVTLRGGGVVFYLGALLHFVSSGGTYPWFMLALTMVTVMSFADDVHTRSRGLRFMVQLVAMLLMFYQFGLYTLPWWWIAVALFFCTGTLNAYNFMDGINGITGGYSLVVLLAMIYADHRVVAFVDADFLYTVVCAVLVFAFFNFRKRAKCFAGDVGSVSIAFILLFLLGRLAIATNDISWIVLLAVYGVDATLTLVHRLLLHEDVALPHRKHAYQLMANELRIPHTVVSLIYMALQALVNVGYFYFEVNGYIYLVSVIAVLSLAYLLFMKKYFHLHKG
ncbi:MAG: glycosyltransferase family 4 protein [Prevotellaceae bacterium]|jgi:UDP-N-acetylmuramyl pentapeptide phosphotransferase/UDP-N-acetylglucosamine-1-phosphate transferase|nr:glycosyltransferase family 4 protein [Prevotellaceae bacterium]